MGELYEAALLSFRNLNEATLALVVSPPLPFPSPSSPPQQCSLLTELGGEAKGTEESEEKKGMTGN